MLFIDTGIALVISEQTGGPWLLSSMYISTEYRRRRGLWSKICRLVSQSLPSIVIGDFNYFVGPQEDGGRHNAKNIMSREFMEFMGDAS